MVDSTPSGDIVDQGAARTPEPVVERDACGQCQEPLGDASAQVVEGASAVALEGEDVLAGPEDRLDPLAYRSEMNPVAGLVLSRRPDDRGVELTDRRGELTPGVALVADEGLPAASLRPFEQLDPHLALVALGRGEGEGPRSAVGREEAMEAKTPEEAGMRGAVAVVGGIAEGRAACRLDRAGALQRGGIDQQHIVVEARGGGGEDAGEPLDRLAQAGSALVEAGLLGQLGEEVVQALAGNGEEAAVRGDAHDRLGDAEGRDLGVGDPAAGVSGLLGQEIVRRAINDGAESVEVGVHRGLSVDGCFGTADFGLSASNPSITAAAVESTI